LTELLLASQEGLCRLKSIFSSGGTPGLSITYIVLSIWICL